jgi:hypothetical protein
MEAVQEDLIEGCGKSPPAVVWPQCPEHANHPLWLRSPNRADRDAVADDPAWVCDATGQAVAELGQL